MQEFNVVIKERTKKMKKNTPIKKHTNANSYNYCSFLFKNPKYLCD